MRGRSLLLISILALLGAIVAVAIRPRDTSLSRLQDRGSIRIGYASEAPFSFAQADGQVTGAFPETARIISTRLGIPRVIWKQVDFDLLIDELQAGRIDVIAAGLFITEERVRQVRFSQPAARVTQALLVRKGNPHRLHAYADAIQSDGTRVAVLRRSYEEDLLLAAGMAAGRLVYVPDVATGQAAVVSGRADALALSAPTLRWMTAREPLRDLQLADPFHQTEIVSDGQGQAAFAFRLDDRALAARWDRELQACFGSDDYYALWSRFGFAEGELPKPREADTRQP